MIRRALAWLFGSPAGGVADTVRAAGEVADELHTSEEEKGAIDLQDTASARGFAAPVGSPGAFNTLVDGFNRLIRPGVTVWLLGGFNGWWRLPDAHAVDPVWFQVFMLVVGFWFGGRMLLKDLPGVIRAILALRRAGRA